MSFPSFHIPAAKCIIPILLFGKYGSTNSFLLSSNFGKIWLAIQLHPNGKNSVSTLSTYTLKFIANPSDPKILQCFKVSFKLFCQTPHTEELFSNENTPMFTCGANAIFLAFCIFIFDETACLKF